MKALENRTLDSKREMDIMAALDELQTLNKRQARVDTEAALAALHRSAAVSEDDQARPPAQTLHRDHPIHTGLAFSFGYLKTIL